MKSVFETQYQLLLKMAILVRTWFWHLLKLRIKILTNICQFGSVKLSKKQISVPLKLSTLKFLLLLPSMKIFLTIKKSKSFYCNNLTKLYSSIESMHTEKLNAKNNKPLTRRLQFAATAIKDFQRYPMENYFHGGFLWLFWMQFPPRFRLRSTVLFNKIG